MLSILLLGWVAGFVLFVVTLQQPPDKLNTDAIVVLTGGSGRIERGLALLSAGRARRMLISGVDRTVRTHELAMRYPGHATSFACCVDLGREAVDTRSNAEETAAWMMARHYRSVRLVTTDWHMPRGRFELAHALHQAGAVVEIVPEPVRSEPGLSALVREYNKYLLRRAAVLAGK
nr:YdcF family protein [Sphingomonas quercus]